MDTTDQLPQIPRNLQAYLNSRDRQRQQDAERSEQARQALLDAWNAAKQPVANPDCWRGYAGEFRQLAEQERQQGPQNRLMTSCDWVDGWQRLAGDRLLAQRFGEIAKRAGSDLNCPQGYRPSDFWQACLFFHLKETGGTKMFTSADDSSCGALTDPLHSSEELCLWLAVQEAKAAAAKALPEIDLFATPAMREAAIVAYTQAETCTREELASRCKVAYQDLNTWKLYRHEKFSKNGTSGKVKRIEDNLRAYVAR